MVERVKRQMDCSGIYQIRNLVDGKRYVGSAIHLGKRWGNHLYGLNRGEHCSHKLLRAWKKYGAANFVFEVLEVCAREVLLEREQHWMDALGVVKNGYNIAPTAGSPLGRKLSKKACKQISEAQLRAGADPEERRRRSERAKQQHREGNFGRSTWTPSGERRMRKLMKEMDRSNSVVGLKKYWKDPANRAKQSAKAKAGWASDSAEMGRRGALGREKAAAGIRAYWADPVKRAKHMEALERGRQTCMLLKKGAWRSHKPEVAF